MRLLILFAAWAKDDSENSHRWINWYREIFDREFADDDKFVAINYDSSPVVENRYHDLPRLIGMERVPENLHINSDAAAYQLCLDKVSKILNDYTHVFFLHTKGASYDFQKFGTWRAAIEESVCRRSIVNEAFIEDQSRLIADRGHLIQGISSIRACEDLASRLGLDDPVFHIAAGTSIYYAPAHLVDTAVRRLPRRFLNKKLSDIGQNRFFFEGIFPSLLIMLGASPMFVGGAELNPFLSNSISYDCDPAHNSALVMLEYHRRKAHGKLYRQAATPYISGSFDHVKSLYIQYERS